MGPFLRNAPLLPPGDDVLIGLRAPSCLVSFCGHTPGACRMVSALAPALAAAVRMIDRVHGHASDPRAPAEPACPAGLAECDILMVGVAELADSGVAFLQYEPDLAGRKLERGVLAFLGHELRVSAGASHYLAALALLHLDVMDECADRYRTEGQRVARLYIDSLTGYDRISCLELLWGEYVALLAVGICKQGYIGRADGVVLNGRYLCRNVGLVALEVDDPVG